ncbi:MAG: hypothetical protein JW959_00685 [Pirellulales bacterium]|nr:hypothetical protein [Pirellulales bacterium]
MVDKKNQEEKIPLRWRHIRCIRLTPECIGGILAGFGIGIAIANSLANVESFRSNTVLVVIGGLFLATIGSLLAMHAQDRYRYS